MDRESAVALKSELAEQLFRPPDLFDLALPRYLRPAGRAIARRMSTRIPPLADAMARSSRGRAIRPSLALGIAVDPEGDHKLAVRIQARGPDTERKLGAIRDATAEVDVQEIGRVVKRSTVGLWQRDRQRPLRIGSSIGHSPGTAGTLGCFVAQRDGKLRMLSNNHVLAAENLGHKGDPLLQPGNLDLGQAPGDIVGELESFIPLLETEPNRVDCALASVSDGVEADVRTLDGTGQLEGLVSEEDAHTVGKLGRTTGTTRGTIEVIELDNVVVEYGLGDIRFDGVMQIESSGPQPFSDGGDSGALIYTADTRLAVGLLFAGTASGGANGQGRTFAHPISTVLKALDVTLVR